MRPSCALLVAVLIGASAPALAQPAPVAALYDRYCLACHGENGDGKGPASPFVWPRPRDFTRGELKWRSTPSGQPATAGDVARAIRHGVPGTSMHGFPTLSESDVAALAARVLGFRAAPARAAAPVAAPAPPPRDAALIARGEVVWRELGCAECHGASGRGDGPAAAALRDGRDLPAPPYDLTAAPLRRPRAPGEPAWSAIYLSLVTGLDGTPMPAYDGAAPPADLWAVAAYVDAIRAPDRPTREVAAPLAPLAIALDKASAGYRAGTWPGAPSSPDAIPFGKTLRLFGPPPPALTPAQASPSSRQCARCHAKQVREWRGSIHAAAGSPGLLAQLIPLEAARAGAAAESCQRCHGPLAEQHALIRPAHAGGDEADRRYKPNPRFDPALREEGVTCAACHVREHRRFGPPRATDGRRLMLFGYPLTELAIYQRADLCLPCHQLEPRAALAGRPLLDTYREWLDGPYMRRGVQCQHCHMPDREHGFRGIHDRDTFLQAIRLETLAVRGGAVVTVRARLSNVGAGHSLPTTPTPAAFLRVELLDADGDPIDGASKRLRIGRHLAFEGGFQEIEDTRIPPGQARELAAGWSGVEAARVARVTLEVWPDEYYERLYRSRLAARQPPAIAALYQQALDRALAARYVAIDRTVPIEPR